jgi:hypothetical protein
LLSASTGLPFGHRELHGRITVVLLPQSAGDTIPHDMIQGFVGPVPQHLEPVWKSRLQVITLGQGTPTNLGVVHHVLNGEPAQLEAFTAAVRGTAGLDAGSSTTFVAAMLDPWGRVRGRYTASAEGHASLVSDILLVTAEQVPVVSEILDSPWLEGRREQQLAMAETISARHDFSFVDQQPRSGIRFLHQIVDDAGRDYKGVHYDHGNGVAVADVDGDGRLDLYFVNQLGPSSLYRNLGDGRFEDITATAGVAVGDRITVSASFADIDNDGDPDLFVTSVRAGNLLFRNEGGGRFVDVTAASGLNSAGHCSGAAFFDYDQDGRLDLLVCHVGVYSTDEQGRGGYYVGFKDAFSGHLKPERTEPSRLYRNIDGVTFEDVTERTGLTDQGWTGDAVILDGNRDGWPDVYLPNMQGNDQYFQNNAGQTFVDRASELFPKTPFGSMGVALVDFDNDLDADLFVTDMHSDMAKDIMPDYRSQLSVETFHEEEKLKMQVHLPESLLQTGGRSLFGNAFYRNDGPDQFAEVSDDIGVENYWPWGLSTGDVNADGFEDLFIASSMNYPYRYAVNSLLLNEGGKAFRDAEFITGIEPRRNSLTAQPWFTVDCSQPVDERLQKLCEGRQGEITVWGSLGSRSSVVADFDDDGDLDIITGEFNDVPMVLMNDLAQRHTIHWLKVVLEGTRSNRQALGAEVVVSAGGRTLLKCNDGRTGYLSHGVQPLYFGLGDANSVDAIEVRWPDGRVQTIAGPIAGQQTLRIREE